MRHFFLVVFYFCSSFFADAQQITLVTDTETAGMGHLVHALQGGNHLFLVTRAPANAYSLWISDGDSSNTALLHTFDGIVGGLVWYNDKLHFAASEAQTGFELWSSDGTVSGTTLVRDINPGPGDGIQLSGLSHFRFAILNSHLYFAGTDGSEGFNLWSSDGSSSGTLQVLDITPGVQILQSGIYTSVVTSGNKLFFGGSEGSMTAWLYSSDGTPSGTTRLESALPGAYSDLIPFDGKIVFGGALRSATDTIIGIVVSDGSENGTNLLLPGYERLVNDFAVLNNKLYFLGQAFPMHGLLTLVVTDGLPANTMILDDSLKGFLTSYSPKLCFLTCLGNKVYYLSDKGPGHQKLFMTDGTVAGTLPLIQTGPPLMPLHLMVHQNRLYFKASDSSRMDLWTSDGTPGGTQSLSLPNAIPDPISQFIKFTKQRTGITPFGNSLVFVLSYYAVSPVKVYRYSAASTVVSSPGNSRNILFYPNPAGEFIGTDDQTITSIRLFDQLGRLILQQGGSGMSLRDLSPGFYLVEATNKWGTIRQTILKK